MPKVNVYLPDRLAQEVKELGISLSPVCQEALQREVKKMQALQDTTDEIARAAIRLADEQRATDADDRLSGNKAGRRWVLGEASARELRQLSKAGGTDGYWWNGAESVGLDRDSWPTMLQALEDGSGAETGYVTFASYDFTDAHFEGFVDAALETWEKVQEEQATQAVQAAQRKLSRP